MRGQTQPPDDDAGGSSESSESSHDAGHGTTIGGISAVPAPKMPRIRPRGAVWAWVTT